MHPWPLSADDDGKWSTIVPLEHGVTDSDSSPLAFTRGFAGLTWPESMTHVLEGGDLSYQKNDGLTNRSP